MCSVVGVGAGAVAAPTAGKTRTRHACHLPRDVQHAVLPDHVPARVRLASVAAMKNADLVNTALDVSAAGGAVADAVKKQVFHGHGVDWRQLAALAESLRVNAEALALVAERQIELQVNLGISE